MAQRLAPVRGPSEDALSQHDERKVDEGQEIAVSSPQPFGAEEQAVGLSQSVGQDLHLALAPAHEQAGAGTKRC